MRLVVEKRVQISEQQAQQLEEIAAAKGVTEDSLLAEAVEWFLQREGDLREDWELLRRLEVENGPLPPYRRVPPVPAEDIVFVVGTPVRPETVRQENRP